jgi:hypothetical protein
MVVDGHLRQRAYESVMSNGRRVWGQEMTAGARECLLSHAQAWERAVSLNESILVLEDDVVLVFVHIRRVLPTSCSRASSEIRTALLGGHGTGHFDDPQNRLFLRSQADLTPPFGDVCLRRDPIGRAQIALAYVPRRRPGGLVHQADG